MSEFKQVATIDFRVVGGSLEDGYHMMKEYQLYGQAGEDANIIYRGISIPAGPCESIEEVDAIYQALKPFEKDQEKSFPCDSTKVEVDFYTEEDNLEEVFESMVQYRDHGYADRSSNIVYQDVVIPAGYCNTYSEVVELFQTMVSNDYIGFMEVIASLNSGMVPVSVIEKYQVETSRIACQASNKQSLVYQR